MTTDINSVTALLQVIQSVKLIEQAHVHVRLWFRGQSSMTWELAPGVYRPGFAANEDERKSKESHLTQDFQALGAPFFRNLHSDVELYFLQQHYRMQTRLLDWSLNPLAALFFALDSEHEDGEFFLLDAYHFAEKRGLCTQRASEVRDAIAAIFTWRDDDNGRPLWPDTILAVMPFNVDPRIASQRGCFTFHPPKQPQLAKTHDALKSFKIPARAKSALRKEIGLLGFDEFTIYGDLDHLAARLKRAY